MDVFLLAVTKTIEPEGRTETAVSTRTIVEEVSVNDCKKSFEKKWLAMLRKTHDLFDEFCENVLEMANNDENIITRIVFSD